MSGIVAATAISAGVQAASTAGQMAYQSNLNTQNRKLFRENRDLQRKWALEDRQHLEEYNDPSAQLNRLEKAGINPMLYNDLGNTGESAMPTNPSNNPIEMSAGNVNFSEMGSSIVSAGLQQQQLELNKKKINAEISNINAQTSLTNIQQGLTAKSKEEVEGRIAILGQQLKDLQFEYKLRVKYGDSQIKYIVDSLYYDVMHKRTDSHLFNIFGFPDYIANLTSILASAENTVENTRLASKFAWSAVENALANMKNAKTNENLAKPVVAQFDWDSKPFNTPNGKMSNMFDWRRRTEIEQGDKQTEFMRYNTFNSKLGGIFLQKNVDWYTYNQILNGVNTAANAANATANVISTAHGYPAMPLNMGNSQDTWFDYDKNGKLEHVQRTTRNSYRSHYR